MRIPVSPSDLQGKAFSKVTRALQKAWPHGPLGYMHAQNLAADLLGYRNLHQVQQAAGDTESQPVRALLSRKAFLDSVAWNAYRRHHLSLPDALELASRLHLTELAIDRFTSEAATERYHEEQRGKGKMIFFDEAWYFMQPDWDEATPVLLSAGVPGYRFAVLPDRRVFLWKKVTALLHDLPTDYPARLREEDRYAHLSTDDAIEQQFLREELYPMACVPLLDAVRHEKVRPHGVDIAWLFDDTGRCIGRALRNAALQAFFPTVYDSQDDRALMNDLGRILCGETIDQPPAPRHLDPAQDIAVLTFRPSSAYEWEKRIEEGTPVDQLPHAERRALRRLPDSLRVVREGGTLHLAGSTFVEAGQTYLREQRWIEVNELPEGFLPRSAVSAIIAGASDRHYLDSADALPAPALQLHHLLTQQDKLNKRSAAKRVFTASGIETLITLLYQTAHPAQLDAWCDQEIDEYLPTRLEDDGPDEDHSDLLQERQSELSALRHEGQCIQAVVPQLSRFKETSLGLLLLLSQGHYPGSRYRGMASMPSDKAPAIACHLVAYMLLSVQCRASTTPLPEETDQELLAFAILPVLDGDAPLSGLPDTYRAYARLLKDLREQQKAIDAARAWQTHQGEMAHLRERGTFLYAGEPISPTRPKSLMESMGSHYRKTNAKMATQSLADFTGTE